MRQAHIEYSASDLDYSKAAKFAANLARKDVGLGEPVLVAWYDRRAARMSPVIEGADLRTRWRDYGVSHGGRLEIDVAGDYEFVYADSSEFDHYEECPYINIRDAQGSEYICHARLLKDRHTPTNDACVALDEWTSKLT
jgi:hypothetical protein